MGFSDARPIEPDATCGRGQNPKISKPNAGRLFILDLRMRRQAVGDRPAVVDEKLKDFQAPADEFNSDVHGIDCECTQTYRKPYVYAFRPWGRTETMLLLLPAATGHLASFSV